MPVLKISKEKHCGDTGKCILLTFSSDNLAHNNSNIKYIFYLQFMIFSQMIQPMNTIISNSKVYFFLFLIRKSSDSDHVFIY